eukprot:scaffold287323_cov19-Prasinocladus_malaysianus.AAC.1
MHRVKGEWMIKIELRYLPMQRNKADALFNSSNKSAFSLSSLSVQDKVSTSVWQNLSVLPCSSWSK